jgi:hypothetical protein
MSQSADPNVSAFHWNAGAWFGMQLGSSIWLLPSAARLYAEAPHMSLVLLGTFALMNGLGVVLWRQRRRLPMYRALQFFLFGVMVLSYGTMLALDLSGHLPTLFADSPNPRWTAYGVLLIIPGLMVLYYFWERLRVQRS